MYPGRPLGVIGRRGGETAASLWAAGGITGGLTGNIDRTALNVWRPVRSSPPSLNSRGGCGYASVFISWSSADR